MSPSLSGKEALKKANDAVEYVQDLMRWGAVNKLSDMVNLKPETFMYGNFFAQLVINPAITTVCVTRLRRIYPLSEDIFSEPGLRSVAETSSDLGCGNCREQAAIAFVWLMKQNVGPLDFMSRTQADHAFVVIGRTGLIKDYRLWGEDCVICDPWHERAYPAREVEQQMYGGGMFAPRSQFRWQVAPE